MQLSDVPAPSCSTGCGTTSGPSSGRPDGCICLSRQGSILTPGPVSHQEPPSSSAGSAQSAREAQMLQAIVGAEAPGDVFDATAAYITFLAEGEAARKSSPLPPLPEQQQQQPQAHEQLTATDTLLLGLELCRVLSEPLDAAVAAAAGAPGAAAGASGSRPALRLQHCASLPALPCPGASWAAGAPELGSMPLAVRTLSTCEPLQAWSSGGGSDGGPSNSSDDHGRAKRKLLPEDRAIEEAEGVIAAAWARHARPLQPPQRHPRAQPAAARPAKRQQLLQPLVLERMRSVARCLMELQALRTGMRL